MDEHSYCVQQNEDYESLDRSKMDDAGTCTSVHIKEEVVDFADQISTHQYQQKDIEMKSQCFYGAESCDDHSVLPEIEFSNSGSSVEIKREVQNCGINTTINKGGTIKDMILAPCNEFSCVNVEETNAEQDGRYAQDDTNKGWESNPIYGEVQSQNEPATVKLEGLNPDDNVDLDPIDANQYSLVKIEVKLEDAVEEKDGQQEDSRCDSDNEKDGDDDDDDDDDNDDDNQKDAQLEFNDSCTIIKKEVPECNDTEDGINDMNDNDSDDDGDDNNCKDAQLELSDSFVIVKEEILEENHAEDGILGMNDDQMDTGDCNSALKDGNEGNSSVLTYSCDNEEEERVQRSRVIPINIKKVVLENDVSLNVGGEKGEHFSGWDNHGQSVSDKNIERGQDFQMASSDEDRMGQADECVGVISNRLVARGRTGGTKHQTTINQSKQQNTRPSILYEPESIPCIRKMAKKDNPATNNLRVDLALPAGQCTAFKCKWCELRHSSTQHIYAHQRISHKDEVSAKGCVSVFETWYRCLLCTRYLCTSMDMLLDHAREQHPPSIKFRTYFKQQDSVSSQMIGGKSKETLKDGEQQGGDEHVLSPTLADSVTYSYCKKDANSICQLQKEVKDAGSKTGLSVRCNICKRHDRTPSELNAHVGEHLYKCYFCPEAFLGMNLIEHIVRKHWYCSDCKTVYRDRSHSLDHTLNCKGSVFYCPHCSAKGKTLGWMKRHTAEGHSKLKCLYCTARFRKRAECDAHIACDHCSNLHRYCRSCSNSAYCLNLIQHHLAVAHGVFLQRCRYCNMLLHAEQVICHEESHRYFTCVLCGLHFTRRTHWEGHMMQDHSKFKQMCGCCGESVKVQQFLKHECRLTSNIAEVDEVAAKDGGSFDSRDKDSQLMKPQIEPKSNNVMQHERGNHVRKKRKHKDKQTGTKKDKIRCKWYDCHACPMSFREKRALRKHMKKTKDEYHQEWRKGDEKTGSKDVLEMDDTDRAEHRSKDAQDLLEESLSDRDGSEFGGKDADDLCESQQKQQTISSVVDIEQYPALAKFLSDYETGAEVTIKPNTLISPETLKSLVLGIRKRTIEDNNSDDSAVVAAVPNEKRKKQKIEIQQIEID